jgi:hypothetical protein
MPREISDELPFHKNIESFIAHLREIHDIRKGHKIKGTRKALAKSQRLAVLQKTDSKCHICGKPITIDHFQADHVKSHITGGTDSVDNFLPSCNTCNNYRWHYGWEDIQYILKIGIWAKGQMEISTKLGLAMAQGYLKHENQREKRRKTSRSL